MGAYLSGSDITYINTGTFVRTKIFYSGYRHRDTSWVTHRQQYIPYTSIHIHLVLCCDQCGGDLYLFVS